MKQRKKGSPEYQQEHTWRQLFVLFPFWMVSNVSGEIRLGQPPGLIGRMTGGTRAALTGAWSASRSNCENEVLVLYENDGAGTVEWWRQDSKRHGLLPWRTGRWDLRDGTLIMSFNHRVEYSRLVGKVQSGSINETAQFDLVNAEDSELRLAATGGSLSPGFLFLGGEE